MDAWLEVIAVIYLNSPYEKMISMLRENEVLIKILTG